MLAVTAKRALIVDDSKSARVILSRLLEKHDLMVDTRDSAETALLYLADHVPDVIFMDHSMAGMDGLAALELIKSDPRTASVPVLMYTSREGGVYADEARSRGADGVLAKQLAPGDITRALVGLRVIPEVAVTPTPPVSMPVTPPVMMPVPESPDAGVVAPSLATDTVRAVVEPLLSEHGVDVRRYVAANLDALGTRLVADVTRELTASARGVIAALTPPRPEPLPPPEPPKPPYGWIVATVFGALLTVALAVVAVRQHIEVESLRATVARQAGALAAPVAVSSTDGSVWPKERYLLAYGEAPFAKTHIDALGKWLETLERRGFVGTAQVTVSYGDYCLAGNPAEGYLPAPSNMPASACDLHGSPPDENRSAEEREPPALATLVRAVAQRTQGAVTVRIVDAPHSETGYPPVAGATAGAWNGIAAEHHGLEFVALPRPTQ